MIHSFKALVVDHSENNFSLEIKQMSEKELPEGEVLIRVHYSSLNYKDGLACTPNGKIVRQYPHIPGIDLAGIVVASSDPSYQIGDQVIATSYEIGVSHFGGFSEYAKVKAEWIVPLPEGLSLQEAMIYGTAGFTAALSVYRLIENGLTPNQGKVLVTGASGGVGSVAVAILTKLGFEVEASTGKAEAHDYLISLGAKQVYSREEIHNSSIRALDKQRWSGAVDPVGGETLASIISQLQYQASVAVSGLTGGTQVPTTVFPFILRGVNVLGIDSVFCPMPLRQRIWELMASEYKPNNLDQLLSKQLELSEVAHYVPLILAGKIKGRCIVALEQ